MEGIKSGVIFGFASDVFSQEPWQNQVFAQNNNVFVTPHVGAYTKKAKDRISLETLQIWNDFNSGT